MRASASLLIAFSFLLTSPGCATVLQGRYQDLNINSNPPGATFEVDGITGTTPATVPVLRKQRHHIVTISKPGYETAQISVGREPNAWILGNVIFGIFGLPGFGVDLISGSAFELSSTTAGVNMVPAGQLAQQPPANGPALSGSRVVEAQHVQPPPKPIEP